MPGNSTRENRETPLSSRQIVRRGRAVQVKNRNAAVHGSGESEGRVLPTTSPNKDAPRSTGASAEGFEGRRPTKENTEQRDLVPDPGPDMGESRRLLGVRNRAQQDPQARFTALLHHVTVGLLTESFYALKRTARPGVDGMTWQEYETDLAARLTTLHERVQRGTYRAQPSKRAYIPKADGRLRPLGMAAVEDKIVQRAVGEVLTQVYEADFLGFSYGFRPGRSQHDALDALWVGLMRRRVNWVLDADIRGFFDTINHEWLRQFVEHRIADPRVLRLLQKWLRAGVSEDGEWSRTEVGTPQGAVISPLLANIYLHYVFDLWVQRWRTQHATGAMIVVRYADDIVMGFERRADAERCLAAWRSRLAQFGLELHPEKTRLLEFGRAAARQRQQRGEGKPETFNFLGFTHVCGTTRKGRFTVRRKTMRTRLRAKLRHVKEQLRQRWHETVPALGRWLRRVVAGYCNYHAVPGNGSSIERFRKAVARLWLRALQRRSQRGRRLTWRRFGPIVEYWLPLPRILHPWPDVRFAAKHPR